MTVTVIGSGAWALTVAKIIAENGQSVSLWSHSASVADEINKTHRLRSVMAEMKLPKNIEANHDLKTCLANSRDIVLGVASPYISIVKDIAEHYANQRILTLTKGLVQAGGDIFIHAYIRGILGDCPLAVLSGPNLAAEIAEGKPAASVVAAESSAVAKHFQALLAGPRFRIYTATDVFGVELGGILKNIFAIVAGICDGLNLGDNAKAALMSRSLQEMIRFGDVFGAKRETFFGLAGLGDLIATCSSPKSRNWKVGYRVATEESDAVPVPENQVAEGVRTTKIVYQLAKEHNIAMPITTALYRVLYDDANPLAVLDELMMRELKPES